MRHLNRPWRPQEQEGSRRVPGAGTALLQRSTFLTGTHQWFSFPQLASSPNHSRRRSRGDGEHPYPNKAQWRLLSGVPGLAWSPQPSTLLQASVCPSSNSISCTGIQLPGNLPSGGSGAQTGPDLFPPLASALKITQVATQRSWRRSFFLPLHLPRAAQRASLNLCSVISRTSPHSWSPCPCTRRGQLARIQLWKEQSLDFKYTEVQLQVQEDPLMMWKWAGLTDTFMSARSLYISIRRDAAWPPRQNKSRPRLQ